MFARCGFSSCSVVIHCLSVSSVRFDVMHMAKMGPSWIGFDTSIEEKTTLIYKGYLGSLHHIVEYKRTIIVCIKICLYFSTVCIKIIGTHLSEVSQKELSFSTTWTPWKLHLQIKMSGASRTLAA